MSKSNSSLAALLVGKVILNNTAILLPEVYSYFKETLMDITKQCNISMDSDMEMNYSSVWLRSQVSLMLEPHLNYHCAVKCYGTILYRYGGDLLHALTVALQTTTPSASPSPSASNEKRQLTETCLSLNEKLWSCIHRLKKQDKAKPHCIEEIDIEAFIQELDPNLWEALCLLTQPSSFRAQQTETHIRRVRCYFCACTIMFTIDSECCFPLHTFICDAIETCGGSSRLIKLLNRLGICACLDTHDRYIQHRVEKLKEKGPMSNYLCTAFSVASGDNLDFIHGCARVYCGNQESSWHGTIVQIVQPKPNSLTDKDPTTPDHQFSSSGKRLHPITSPDQVSPVPKKSRRTRTGTEGRDLITNTERRDLIISTSRDTTETIEKQTFTLQSFQLSSQSFEQLREMCDQYILQRVVNASGNCEPLIDLKTYLILSQNLPTPECSNVIYYTVLAQKCDDKGTILTIINDLYNEFIATKKKEAHSSRR